MKADDLVLGGMLQFEPGGGVLRLGSARALVLDVVALGLLRKELFDTLGETAARGVLSRLGYAHGVRTAESARAGFPWDDERQWRMAGTRFAMLQGFAEIEPVGQSAASPEAILRASYEAEQHLLHFGRSEVPVCWTLAGFASGYFSHARGQETYFLEEQCVARGDPVCRVVGRSRAEWGDREEIRFFDRHTLDARVAEIAAALRETERKLRARRRTLDARDREVEVAGGLVARSEAMRRVVDTTRRVAAVDATVLITGETGVGKERVARLIHEASARAGGPFVAVNCGAVPEALLESELFGHARGAFTGATHDRPGLFEAAHQGTLFLDEIGEMPLSMQVKLLRALQSREVRRVGENQVRPFDARLVAATNRELGAEIRAGRFREDLYYRLRVVEVQVPPLRERPEDILPLARVLLSGAAERMKRRVTGLSARAADRLLQHQWPGNVRELENSIERAVALAAGSSVEVGDLPQEVRSAAPGPVARTGRVRTLEDVERAHVLAALEQLGGNQRRTAAALGIGEATLYRKLRRWRHRARPRR